MHIYIYAYMCLCMHACAHIQIHTCVHVYAPIVMYVAALGCKRIHEGGKSIKYPAPVTGGP